MAAASVRPPPMQKPMQPVLATPCSALSQLRAASTTWPAMSRSSAIASFSASSGSSETTPS